MKKSSDDIVSLARELERIKNHPATFDVVAPTDKIAAIGSVDAETKSPELHLAIAGHKDYPLTHHGSLQLAEKCGIPMKYYEKMLDEGLVDLTAENVNAWLSKQADRRLVRVAEGRIRALLSDRYRVLDNYDLAYLVMDRAKENKAIVQRCDLTETHMYIKLVVPGYVEYLKEQAQPSRHEFVDLRKLPTDDDPAVPGLIVSNSEVGAGAFSVEPFLFRLSCWNGVIGTSTLYKVHLGQRLEVGELILKDDTRKAMDEALWGQVRDTIDATFNGTILHNIVKAMRDAKKLPIEDPKEVVDVQAKNLNLSDEKKVDLLRYFAKEGDTIFGLVNGLTRLAQDFNDYEEQVKIERAAGEILYAKAAPVAAQ